MIFEELLNRGINFKVGIADYLFKLKNTYSAKDYFVFVTDKKSYHKLHNMKFHQDSKLNVLTRDLTDIEISFFKKNKDCFTNVLKDKTGRIYELTDIYEFIKQCNYEK